MANALVVLLVAVALLAGCGDPSADAADPADAAGPTSTMSIVGLVQDESLVAVAGANVRVRMLELNGTTDATGSFRFEGLVPSAYLVDVNASGYEDATLTAEPSATMNASLNFILVKPVSLRPLVTVEHFKGIYQCAVEVLIIPGSCDVLLEEAGTGQDLFADSAAFQVGLRPNWHSVIIDVDFDLSNSPGLEALRLTVRGIDDPDSQGEYQQYGRFASGEPFTARLDVGGSYQDGIGSVPGNLSALALAIYPQGHGYHAACGIHERTCALGVGAGVDVQFDLYVSVFYNHLPPAGYSLLDG